MGFRMTSREMQMMRGFINEIRDEAAHADAVGDVQTSQGLLAYAAKLDNRLLTNERHVHNGLTYYAHLRALAAEERLKNNGRHLRAL